MNCGDVLQHSPFGPQWHTTNQTTCKVTVKEKPRTSCAQRLSHHAHAVSSDEALSSFPQNREREDSLDAFVTLLHPLNLINIHLLATSLVIVALTTILIELEIAIAIALLAIRIRLIDLSALG